jgi:hypothetical protein
VALVGARPTLVGEPHLGDPVLQIPDAIPLGMAVFGLAWMVRMYRCDPEAGPSRWRFHEWD